MDTGRSPGQVQSFPPSRPAQFSASRLDIRIQRYPLDRATRVLTQCCHLLSFNSLLLCMCHCFCFSLERDWTRDKFSWMTQIQPRSHIRRGGMLAIIARTASPSQMGHRCRVEHGTSASGSAVSSPRTDSLALVEQSVVLPVYSSTLRSQVSQPLHQLRFL